MILQLKIINSYFVLLIIIIVTVNSSSIAQVEKQSNTTNPQEVNTVDYYEPRPWGYENKCYNDSIKTILLHPDNGELQYPIIRLNTDEQLKLSFDHFGNDPLIYHYTIIHCDVNWNPSDLNSMEYIDGFDYGDITDYEFSFNTIQPYVHYELKFPNEILKPRISGNYLLKVYNEFKDDQVVFTMRFLVLDNKLSISGQVRRPSRIAEREYKHQIDFKIDRGNFTIDDPFNSLKVVLMQNGRWDNVKTGMQPTFINDKELIYNF